MPANDKYTQSVQSIAEQFQQVLGGSGLLPPEYLREIREKLQSEIYALLQSPKPKIMVYGIYNSGKSTLVNALCEREAAKVADRPMTDRIDEYDAGKYILIDSPGVDAPVEHERIADAQLNKCHIILFVVSSKGGFESRTNYEKMLPLIRMDIPFYIILNDRGVELPRNPQEREKANLAHRQELNEMKRKIVRNLITVSGDQRIGDKYEVIVLNAKRAWTAVQKENRKMLEASGVPNLRNRMEQILEEGKALKWLQAPIAALDAYIGETESHLMGLIGEDSYGEARQLLQAKMNNMRETMKSRLKGLLRNG